MNTKLVCGFLTLCIIFITVSKINAEGAPQKEMKTLPAEVVINKIRGGLLGEILGFKWSPARRAISGQSRKRQKLYTFIT